MTSNYFHIVEHIVNCPRLARAAEIGPQSVQLAVKQYSPKYKSGLGENTITIVAAHANGFAKELYEPLWEWLSYYLRLKGIGIRSIWIADAAYQGASGFLNESSQFVDVSWQDHSEDLLHVLHYFRSEMKQPIYGIGHSMGGCHIATLSVMHRRIFASIILLDPAIGPADVGLESLQFDKMTLRRQVRWPSRKHAETAIRKIFKTWNSRVIDIYLKNALRDDPPAHAGSNQQLSLTPVSLVTSRYQELVNYIKPGYIYDRSVNDPRIEYQSGLNDGFFMLGLITCSAFFVCGGMSSLSTSRIRKLWLDRTAEFSYAKHASEKRAVEETIIPNVGHFLPMEAPESCAEVIATWINSQFSIMKERVAEEVGIWMNLSQTEKSKLSDEWIQSLRSKI